MQQPVPPPPAWPSPRRQALSGCLRWAGQFVVVTGCVLVMDASLKTNGTVLTAAVEGTRFRVWLIASAVALLAVVTVLASLSGMYAHSGRGKGLLLLQVVVVLTLAALVIWFALAIPVPAGTHSAPLFGGD
jgi:hypothetical protein